MCHGLGGCEPEEPAHHPRSEHLRSATHLHHVPLSYPLRSHRNRPSLLRLLLQPAATQRHPHSTLQHVRVSFHRRGGGCSRNSSLSRHAHRRHGSTGRGRVPLAVAPPRTAPRDVCRVRRVRYDQVQRQRRGSKPLPRARRPPLSGAFRRNWPAPGDGGGRRAQPQSVQGGGSPAPAALVQACEGRHVDGHTGYLLLPGPPVDRGDVWQGDLTHLCGERGRVGCLCRDTCRRRQHALQ
mmetsp:Transcript_12388/g.24558  ORF Transcript_12388/g.24558 Transcript_12388/m.24558 type:complete len:238 (+) Transcript_12388:683-1396(+)